MLRHSRSSAAPTFGALLLAFTTVACGDPEEKARRHVEKGDTFVAAGEFQEALLEYRNAAKLTPRNGEARYKLAETLVRTGRPADAAREYIRAADLLTTRADVQVKAGAIMLAAGDFDQARKYVEAALAAEPGNVEAHIVLANVLAGLKDLDGALEQLQDAIELSPEDARPYTSIGTLQARHGNRPEAEAAFKKAIDLAPKAVAPRLALAYFYWASQRPGDAEATLKLALSLDGEHQQANHMLATFYLTANRREEAEAPLLRLANQQEPVAMARLADLYVATGRTDQARTLYQTLKDSRPNRVLATARLASLDYADKKTDEAHRAVDELLKEQPNQTALLMLKARWYLMEQRPDEALKLATQAVRADPGSAAASYTLGLVHMARREQEEAARAFTETLRLNPRVASAAVQLSRLMLARGDAKGALTQAESARRLDPDNADARLGLAAALLATPDLSRAEAEIRTLRAEYPQSSAVHVLQGRLLIRKGDTRGAVAAFDRALDLNPDDWQALTGRVALDVQARRTAEGRSRLESALARRQNNSELLLIAARFELTTGDRAAAERYLRRSIDADAGNLDAYSALAGLYLLDRKLEEAKAEFRKLAARRPDSVGYRTMIAMILEAQQQPDAAIKEYEAIVKMSAASAVAANNLAYHYAMRGERLDEALQLAQRAKQQLPDRPEVNDTLGWIYYKKNLPTLAIPPLESSVAKQPDNAMYRYHLGLAYASAGRKEAARQALEHALSLQPDFEGAHEARLVLESLKG